jgi:Derlin-2/3
MANVRQGFNQGQGPLEQYYAIPAVTRYFATACVAATVAAGLGLLDLRHIYLQWPAVFRKLQIWRLLTNFVFLGGFKFATILQVAWLIQYGKALETTTFQFSTPDFVYMLLFGMVVMLTASAVPFFYMPFMASSLVFMLIYVWSRNYPTGNVSIWGMLNIQAFYLPFALAALDLMMGGNWKADVLGILVGHLYYFLKVLHPSTGGSQMLETPAFVKRWVHDVGLGNVNPRELNAQVPSQPGFRAFRGAGRRLAD